MESPLSSHLTYRWYPRSCGVYPATPGTCAPSSGSSPLAQGLRRLRSLPRLEEGIIPARAGFTWWSLFLPRPGVDHPRSRGVYGDLARWAQIAWGSSPLARGLRVPRTGAAATGWIIPARAEFTPTRESSPSGGADHPRSRGVYTVAGVPREIVGGSSPLARGLHDHECGGAGVGGIIPARAGFTRPTTAGVFFSSDHPRSRGVYVAAPSTATSAGGSSPLARGLPPKRTIDRLTWRIIPARAGFTWPGRRSEPCRWDHPRSRGVYPLDSDASRVAVGSSPLARGLLHFEVHVNDGTGIIPARAGFTRRKPFRARRRGDHPRSRGVYPRGPGRPGPHVGSSPLARGSRHRRLLPIAGAGIIPARAGFTTHSGLRFEVGVDHPRSRGVYWPARGASTRTGGSSPLARGLLLSPTPHACSLRIIPARAGFTPDGRYYLIWTGDHPRSRGVYPACLASTRARLGSSPLARGLLAMTDATAHGSAGSSPLARGLRRLIRDEDGTVGIIPARAGFTRDPGAGRGTATDHPRSRGVYI